jgi:eukaryotic-like serine/threonine-protein kinase
MEHPAPGRARFGGFELDFKSGELCSIGTADGNHNKVLLREQSFQVLRMLVERGGKIVTRDEIKAKLWPNDTVVDFDHSINATIKTLRRALGDSADNPQYIETLARRGYRLIVATELLESTEGVPRGDASRVETFPEPSGLVGKKVSHYRVLEVIGGGGMGMVYKAEDLKLGRQVALKFLPEELASDPVALKRFEREAQTASALNHPNICTIYGIEEHEGEPFIAMELLEGDTLRNRMAASEPKTIPVLELLDIGMQIADGLQAAHDKDIIHRDIKQANLFLTKQGTVKILDFGLAKLAATEESQEKGPRETSPETGPSTSEKNAVRADQIYTSLTRPGTTAGTAGYMSPEQVRKEKLDSRTDLFSFGMVLYEMAVGRRAFEGETVAEIHDAILNQTAAPAHDVNSAVPRALDAVIAKALEKDRSRRYQSAAEMREDLARARKEPGRRRMRRWVSAAALLLFVAIGCWFYWNYRNRVTVSATDTIVLGDINNRTSDSVFDDALNTALRYGMEQTPYLNILGIDKVFGILAQLNLPPTTKLTPEVARQVCLRTNSKLVIAASIADAGNGFRIGLDAADCQSGRIVAGIRKEVADQNQVVHVLGLAAAQLRRKLGEPAASLARFNKPLEEALSSSVKALQVGTLGYKRHIVGDLKGAIPSYQRALELDPNLALTYEGLGAAYNSLGERDLAVSAYTRAYELRARMTEPSRLGTEYVYYAWVTGEREKAYSVLLQWVHTFPRNVSARLNLSSCLAFLGQPDKAADEAREAARLQPTAFAYAEWTLHSIHAERLNEAQAALDEAAVRKFDAFELQKDRIRLAFLRNDQRAMQELWNQAMGGPDAYRFLFFRSRVEEYHGRFRKARELIQQASDMAPGTAARSSGSQDYTEPTYKTPLWEAESGDSARAVQIAASALRTVSNRDGKLYLALAFARAGNIEQARKMVDALDQDSPLDTLVQNYSLPTIRAAMKLNASDPAGAIAALQPSLKYELSFNFSFNGLYPAYIRGLAYLQLGEGRLAAAEFQKLVDHRGLVGIDVIGALAHLQIARAQKMMGDEASARKWYEDFLALWKDADPAVPIYQQAKAEYAQLGKS